MLVELAIADAYGAGFECADRDFVESNNNLQYVNHRKNLSLVPTGHYTDDTQMTLAIAEALVEDDEFTPLSIAQRFVDCFHRDERRGYNGGFYKFLLDTPDGETFLENIRPDSEKSGAAMRAGPLGLLPDRREIRRRNDIQAALTHDTLAGRTSSYCAALMVHYFRYNMGPKADLGGWLAAQCAVPQLEGLWDKPYVRSLGWHCVHAAITALVTENTMSDVLQRSVAFTGDVDTVATIAVAAGVWSSEIEQNIPDHLYANLENKKYGRDYLKELDAKLRAKYA
jgi:ADP-ribosylglycohydrolase